MHDGALAALVGSRIERIDGPRRDLLALTLHSEELHGCLILRITAKEAAWGWSAERPRGDPASSFVMLMRKHFEGGRIAQIAADGVSATISIRRGTDESELRMERDPPNLLAIAGGVVVGALRNDARAGKPWSRPPIASGPPLELRGEDLSIEARQDDRALRMRTLSKAIARRTAKLRRRIDAIRVDIAREDETGSLRHRAGLLLANHGTIPKGATEATVLDYAIDPPAPISIAIDPARGPKGEADALFRRARKIERGAQIARSRLEHTEREIAVLEAISKEMRSPESDLDRLDRDAARAGARAQERKKEAKEDGTRKAYRTFRSENDRPIFVGRSSADNDVLTLKIARPHDHWLHARGASGSHVIVPLEKNEVCPQGILVDAAHLAAHFSSLRGEALVEINHVSRRHVRKPKGAPAGTVTISRAKVLLLRFEPDRLARLLASEDQG